MSLPGFFDALSEEHRETVGKLLTEVEFEPGTTIFTEGDDGDAAYFIDDGDVRIELELPEVDTESGTRYEGPGSTLGEVALLDRLPRSATAIADTEGAGAHDQDGDLDELVCASPRPRWRHPGARAGRDGQAATSHRAGVRPDVRRRARPDGRRAGRGRWPHRRVRRLAGGPGRRAARPADAGLRRQAEELAAATVEETHVGNADDKRRKNQVAARGSRVAGRPGRRRPLDTDEPSRSPRSPRPSA